MTKPLQGLKVLDLSRVLAGPFAGQLLADLGATVIKIENPKGDDTRAWGPPFIERVDGSKDAAYFHSCNRGKYSVIADLKSPENLTQVTALVAGADVVLENFKLGGLEKYQLDHKALCDAYPKLIYCSITGFGQDGPKSSRAGYDLMIQGLSGIMSLTGDAQGEPQKIGVAFADIVTGLYAVIAIQAAIAARHRTGLGQYIDMALMDCMTGILANQAMNYLAGGTSPSRMGNAHPNIVPYQVFETQDGHAIIAVGNDGQFTSLCDVLGVAALAEDEKYQTNADRVKNRGALIPLLAEILAKWKRSDLLNALEAATVPAGSINSVEEALRDPQIMHRGLVIEPQGIPGLATPITQNGKMLSSDRASPVLGDTSFRQAAKLFDIDLNL